MDIQDDQETPHNFTPPAMCTLTGVDEWTPHGSLAELSATYPIVEWGILYSPKRQGAAPRYPAVGVIQEILDRLPAWVPVALHVCGRGVTDLLALGPTVAGLTDQVFRRGGRVQLNFSLKDGEIDAEKLAAYIAERAPARFITQANAGNRGLIESLDGVHNHQILFDCSGGRGVLSDEWPAPLPGVRCGYAGGLSPDNLADQLPRIAAAAGERDYWIDMESGLRDENDRLDMARVHDSLALVRQFAGRTAF